MSLLEYEHPLAPEHSRLTRAEAVCREARKLLREEFDLDGDWPADAEQLQAQPVEPRQPKDQGRVQRILNATRDFLDRNGGRQRHGHRTEAQG